MTPVLSTELTPKQARFVEEYLVDLNATQAAIRAGYSQKAAEQIGFENLRKPEISAALEQARAKLSAELGLTLDDIAREMRKLAYSNSMDYMRILPNGEPAIDFSRLRREQAAALTEVTVEDFVDGRGEDAREVRRVRYKAEGKRQALMDLAKLLGHVKDKVEHSGGVTVRTQEEYGRHMNVAEDEELAELRTISGRQKEILDILRERLAARERAFLPR